MLLQKKRNFLTTSTLWENKIVPYTIQSGCEYTISPECKEIIYDKIAYQNK